MSYLGLPDDEAVEANPADVVAVPLARLLADSEPAAAADAVLWEAKAADEEPPAAAAAAVDLAEDHDDQVVAGMPHSDCLPCVLAAEPQQLQMTKG